MPPQLVRLLLLTLLLIAAYSVARQFLTPPTFGHYGHYRGAALVEATARPLVFAGAKACDECHGDTGALVAKDRHKGISCESCHGPGRAHARNPDVMPAKLNDQLCLRCHLADAARPAKQRQVKVPDHFPGEKCVDCHVAHQPNKSK
jgi:predicted CXXCH cytochrome family protein